MTVKRPAPVSFATLAVFGCLCFINTATGAEEPLLPNPAEQPLVVARTREATEFNKLLATKPVRAFRRLGRPDSVSLPGTDIRIDSLEQFFAALADAGAENVWYCLTQQGASMAQQGSVLGWDIPDGLAASTSATGVDARPDGETATASSPPKDAGSDALDRGRGDSGVRFGHGVLRSGRSLANGGLRVVLAPDQRVLEDVTGGGHSPGGWRNSFGAFRDLPGPGVGVWTNTRPLFGFLSLLSGIDFRAKLTTATTSVPSGAILELLPRGDDLGFSLRFDQFLQNDIVQSDATPLVARVQRDAMFEATLSSPGTLLDLAPFDTSTLFYVNLNARTLQPRSLHFQAWLNDFGAPAWTATCLMPTGARTQIRRVVLWLEILSKAMPNVSVTGTRSAWGDNLWEIRLGDRTLVLGLVEIAAAGQNNTFVVLSNSVTDWPEPAMLAVDTVGDPSVLTWKARLDGLSERSLLTQALADFAYQAGHESYDTDFFADILPTAESGSIDFLGRDLLIRSDRGGLPLLLVALTELYLP
ncbi:MAG: hypothetical protein LUG50_02895 [Planctomycetaceae bacterium]|nr:hypothetical protein [Planctomycetaceae bacterium]